MSITILIHHAMVLIVTWLTFDISSFQSNSIKIVSYVIGQFNYNPPGFSVITNNKSKLYQLSFKNKTQIIEIRDLPISCLKESK